jgi:hypothetical protein
MHPRGGYWLGPEGDKCRWSSKPVSAQFKEDWAAFAAERASLTVADINADLTRIDAYQRANPP